MHPTATRSSFRSDIEGMRGLAIAAVLMYHLNRAWIPNGFVGVDIFFVISGFVVASSAATFSNQSLLNFSVEFYKRRIKRLLPPLLVVALATIATILVLVPPDAGKLSALRTVLYAIAGLSNIFLAKESADYWHDAAMPNPFLHSWSLGVEAQFYVIFPLLFFFLSPRDGKYWTQGTRITLVSLLAMGSLLLSLWHEQTSPIDAFYQIYGRMWEPLLGVLTYFAVHARKGRDVATLIQTKCKWRAKLIYFSPLIAILALLVVPPNWITTKFAAILACSLASIIIILGTTDLKKMVSSPLDTLPLRFAGRISYSCYLIHWPIITLYSSIIGLSTPIDYVFVIAGIIAGSLALFFFVERNCTGLARRKVGLRKLLFAQTIAIALASSPNVLATAAPYEYDYWGVDHWSYHNNWEAYVKSSLASHEVATLPDTLVQRHVQQLDTFMVDMTSPAPQQESSNTANIFAMGNSFLLSSMPMLIEFSAKNGRSIYSRQIMNCSWHQLINCNAAVAEFKNVIEKSGRQGDVIYLAVRLPDDIRRSPLFNDVLPGLADLASRRGMVIIIQGAMPVFNGFSPKACFSSIKVQRSAQCKKSIEEEFAQYSRAFSLDRQLLELAAQYKKVFVFEPLFSLCREHQCRRGSDGTNHYYFMDEDHLSIRGSLSLGSDFTSFINGIRSRQ